MSTGNQPDNGRPRAGVSRRRFLQGAAAAAILAGLDSHGARALAQAPCAYPNPIAMENRCSDQGTWGRGFALSNYFDAVCGFATKTSVNVGESVDLKLISYDSEATSATLEVWRLGYYGGDGGRLVHSQTVNPLPTFADQGDATPSGTFGLRECASWSVSATIDGAHTAVSGLYLVKIKTRRSSAPFTDRDNHIPFIVRDDGRARDLLVALPTNTWQAYNSWAGKALYTQLSSGEPTVAGVYNAPPDQSRAVKVSFDRPYIDVLGGTFNWPLRTEFPLIWWLEQQGYNLSYTDDYGLHSQAAQLLPAKSKTLVIAGHNEYWTGDAFDNVKAARDAGTNVASFSANTAYWKVRYEASQGGDAGRTLVCFKTVMGTQANAPDNGTLGVNDFGPGETARTGGVNDPLGADKTRGGTGADADKPQFATTTFRDPGAPQGDSNAPNDLSVRGRGRVGPDKPENQLFGVMYVGDDDNFSYPLHVPAGTGGGGEFGAHPAWRHTTLANQQGADIGTNLVGWEFDGIPGGGPYAGYLSRQPAGVKRLTHTNPLSFPGGSPVYVQDAGRSYASTPPSGQGPETDAVTYRASNGALVFASGTIQWSFGLGPHFEYTGSSAAMTRYDSQAQAVIQQATYNILKDGGIVPATPEGIIEDSVPGGQTAGPPTSGPPQPNPKDITPPKLRLGRSRQVLTGRGEVKMRVTCPRDERQGALGDLTLFALLPPSREGGKPRRRRLGARSFQIHAGESKVLTMRLSRRNQVFVKQLEQLRVSGVVYARDPAGNKRRQTTIFRLLAKLPTKR